MLPGIMCSSAMATALLCQVLLALLAGFGYGHRFGDPVVYLTHGGGLRGNQFKFDGTDIAVFLGVRYAQSPTGTLRFKKPVAADPWTGVMDAKISDHICAQKTMDANPVIIGTEDCLFLDITVPGGIKKHNHDPKAVMVYIHGGGYQYESGSYFVPVALAKYADVIVVTVEYRLGAFGFLPDEDGKGNYGLWDQRLALLWIQDNIQRFGGDPRRVTLFGHSAGAGSCWAQAISPHNDENLFARIISESGSIFDYWGWGKTPSDLEKTSDKIKAKLHCECQSVQECVQKVSSTKAIDASAEPILAGDGGVTYSPIADGDFFDASAAQNSFELSKRFDVMAGVVGQQGSLLLQAIIGPYLATRNKTVHDGITKEESIAVLQSICEKLVGRVRRDDCIKFLVKEYDLDRACTVRERLITISDIIGDLDYDTGTFSALLGHSEASKQTKKGTYAFDFTELNFPPSDDYNMFGLVIPSWLRKSAAHFEETAYVFGGPFMQGKKEMLIKAGFKNAGFFWHNIVDRMRPSDRKLSLMMMRFWGNFAKSGNPNYPDEVCNVIWPPFSQERPQTMELKSKPRVLQAFPGSDRLARLDSVIMSAYRSKQ